MQSESLCKAPEVPGHWLWGSLPEYQRGRLEFLESVRREFGTAVTYRLGTHRVFLSCEPDVLKEVLVTRHRDFGKSASTLMLKDFFGESLLTSEGVRWFEDRRLMQPTFSADQVRKFGSTMVGQSLSYAGKLSNGEQRDVLRDMQELTMSIAAETLLGVTLADEVQSIHEPHDLIRSSFDARVEHPVASFPWLPTRQNRRVKEATREIHGIVNAIITRRRGERVSGGDVLSRMLQFQEQNPGQLSDERIRNQVLTFLFAGHETTASVLGWAWYMLAVHPDVENRLYAELDEVLGDRDPEIQDIPNLHYTARFVRETLRLYPSVYMMNRRSLRDCQVGGFNIRRGTTILMSQWLKQRVARFYERPLSVDPDRWTADFQQNLNQFGWFPFGAGPRKCIGDSFAILETILVIATIASRVRFRLQEGQAIVPYPSVTLRPSPGIRVFCEQRRADFAKSENQIPTRVQF